jgi:hypothetical protein
MESGFVRQEAVEYGVSIRLPGGSTVQNWDQESEDEDSSTKQDRTSTEQGMM